MDLLRVSWFPIIWISKDVKHDNRGRGGSENRPGDNINIITTNHE
jgi:hypothetical protein